MKTELLREALCMFMSTIQPWVEETKFSLPKVLTKVTLDY